MNFTGKNYVKLFKWLSTFIPTFGGAYLILANELSLPYGKAVVAICAFTATLLMSAVGISKPEEED